MEQRISSVVINDNKKQLRNVGFVKGVKALTISLFKNNRVQFNKLFPCYLQMRIKCVFSILLTDRKGHTPTKLKYFLDMDPKNQSLKNDFFQRIKQNLRLYSNDLKLWRLLLFLSFFKPLLLHTKYDETINCCLEFLKSIITQFNE